VATGQVGQRGGFQQMLEGRRGADADSVRSGPDAGQAQPAQVHDFLHSRVAGGEQNRPPTQRHNGGGPDQPDRFVQSCRTVIGTQVGKHRGPPMSLFYHKG
jgi:hypothetical protein